MNRFLRLIESDLQAENVSLERFQELLLRLLDYGVLCRDESQVEQQFYDLYLRLENLVDDYFALLGIRILHTPHFNSLRLVPPGAQVPGLEDEGDSPYNGGLRARLSQQDIAVLLVLRAEYDKSLREGAIDEQGCTKLSMEALIIALKNLLGRSLPEAVVERRAIFKRLRQLRLLDFASEDGLESPEAWLRVRPMVVSYVSDDVVQALRGEQDAGELQTPDSANAEVFENAEQDREIAEDLNAETQADSLFGDLEDNSALAESD